jgi:hypothetical protein
MIKTEKTHVKHAKSTRWFCALPDAIDEGSVFVGG